MDITHDNVCSSMLSCFYSHLLSTGRPISSLSLFPEYRAIPNINCSKAILWQFMVVFCGTTVLLLYDIFLNTIEKIIRQLLCLPYSLNTYRKPLPLNCNDIHVEIQVSKQFYS